MQNRFKFRAWDTEEKKMNYFQNKRGMQYNNDEIRISNGWDGCDNPKYWGGDDDDYVDRTDKYILMQCIGLKATNGQLLYEGDIVKFFSCSIIDAMSERHPMEERIGQIVWNEEEMKFDVVVGGKAIPSLCKKIDDNNFELIGNIYENPELL